MIRMSDRGEVPTRSPPSALLSFHRTPSLPSILPPHLVQEDDSQDHAVNGCGLAKDDRHQIFAFDTRGFDGSAH